MPNIRVAVPDDAEAVKRIYDPYVRDTAVSFEEVPPNESEMRARIEKALRKHAWLVCERDAEVVGYAYAGAHRGRAAYRWSVDSSVYVDERHHRSGVARGLYESLFAVLRLQGYRNVYAGTTLPNPASVGFHEAMGFEPVGTYRSVGYKRGEWHDVRWFQRSILPHESDPDPPNPVDQLRETSEWVGALAAGLVRIDG